MTKLIHTIEMIRQKLPALRRHSLKETPTRTIIVDPLLESLGWDIRDPDEVQLEYPCIDGKSVDYALKINKRTVLLVEAKPLDDPLDDVKAITQIVGYAANNGIDWCILTNGIKWRVYRTVERCPAPDKLMYEVGLDPNDSEGMTIDQIARHLSRFSSEEIAKGTLDALGEQTFTDGRVRKAIQMLMADPPSSFVRLVRNAAEDESLTPKRVKESLSRLATEGGAGDGASGIGATPLAGHPVDNSRSAGAKRAWATRRAKRDSKYDESHHLSGKPQEAVQLYRALDRLCMSLVASAIAKRYNAKTINYDHGKGCFCSVHVLRGGLRVWLPLKYGEIESPPSFARDVSNVGHWGRGDLELRITNRTELDRAADFIRQSLERAT